MEGRKQ